MAHSICRSTDRSLGSILAWLKQKYDETDGEGFYRNRDAIRRAHETSNLTVLAEGEDVVAFMVGDKRSWDILEVRPDMRGRGFGRVLAQHYIDQARENDVCVLTIECNPISSFKFWSRLGFSPWTPGEEYSRAAFLTIPKNFELPTDRPRVEVSVALYHEEKNWKSDIEPVIEFSPGAVQINTGEIALAERVICFDPRLPANGNTVIGINVGSNEIYLDKIKDDTAEAVGVTRDSWNNYYLDRIFIP